LQCPNGIVSIGDTREEVARKCGKPNSKVYTEVSPFGGSEAYRERKTYTYESNWTYDPGPNGFVYRLEFSDGKVRFIENTERHGSR
jgi:secreted trypsin-like serine protease